MKAIFSTLNTAEQPYIACSDLLLDWLPSVVKEIDKLWNMGWDLWDIAKLYNRDPDEVAILIIDRVRKGFIKKRPGGVYGRRVKDGIS